MNYFDNSFYIHKNMANHGNIARRWTYIKILNACIALRISSN